jgi:hypothetical protein
VTEEIREKDQQRRKVWGSEDPKKRAETNKIIK